MSTKSDLISQGINPNARVTQTDLWASIDAVLDVVANNEAHLKKDFAKKSFDIALAEINRLRFDAANPSDFMSMSTKVKIKTGGIPEELKL